MLTLQHKRNLFSLISTSKFNLSPQEMAAVLEALNALASEINAETDGGKSAGVPTEKGGDPADEGAST